MCVHLCLWACVFSPWRLLITKGVIWISYDRLNKFYSCYMATVMGGVALALVRVAETNPIRVGKL